LSKPIDRGLLFNKLREWVKDPDRFREGQDSVRNLAGDAVSDAMDDLDIEVPGVDVGEAFRRLGVSKDTLAKMLIRFAEQTEGQMSSLEPAVAGGDSEAVQALAHSVAGAAANLSINDLATAAKELELAIREGKSDWAAGYATVREAWQPIREGVTALQAARDALVKPEPGDNEEGEVSAPEILIGQLEALSSALRDGELGRIEEALVSLREVARGSENRKRFDLLADRAEAYEHEGAGSLVEAWLKELREAKGV